MTDAPVRERLLALAKTYPGLHVRELARAAGVSEQLVLYHVDALAAEGLVATRSEAGYRRVYPAAGAPSPADEPVLALLRRDVPLQIVRLLLETSPLRPGDLARRLKVAPSTITYHLSGLREAGIVTDWDDGLALAEPARMERLLLRWRPPEGLTSRFARQWSAFYRARRK